MIDRHRQFGTVSTTGPTEPANGFAETRASNDQQWCAAVLPWAVLDRTPLLGTEELVSR